MKGGVKLTQFHPEKKMHGMASTIKEAAFDSESSPMRGGPNDKGRELNWEERMKKREKEVADGKREPL